MTQNYRSFFDIRFSKDGRFFSSTVTFLLMHSVYLENQKKTCDWEGPPPPPVSFPSNHERDPSSLRPPPVPKKHQNHGYGSPADHKSI